MSLLKCASMKTNSPKPIIETLTNPSLSDLETINFLASQLGSNSQPLNKTELKQLLSSKTTNILVARTSKKGKIVAMITVVTYRIPYVKKAYLDDFIVDDSLRGHGLGSKLLEKSLSLAKKMGAKNIDLTSNPSRKKAIKLYEKFGFKKRDTNIYRLTFNYEKTK